MNCGVPTGTGMSARKHGSNHIITCSPRCEDCEDCFGSIDFWCPTKVNSDDLGMHCPSKGPYEALGFYEMEGPWDLEWCGLYRPDLHWWGGLQGCTIDIEIYEYIYIWVLYIVVHSVVVLFFHDIPIFPTISPKSHTLATLEVGWALSWRGVRRSRKPKYARGNGRPALLFGAERGVWMGI